MKKTARSARGVSVDFDLLKLKQQISENPAPSDVKQRQSFIESRLRRTRRVPAPAPKITQVEVEAELPAAEEEEASAMRNVPTPPPVQEEKKTTRRTQKARPKSTDTAE